MSKSFSSLYYHLVFATKMRRRLIRATMVEELHAYWGGTLRNLGGRLLRAGGVEDHRHLVMRLPPSLCVAEAANKLKSNSSGWLRRIKGKRLFGWQSGYAAFSVGPSQLPELLRYIENQESHHRRMGFREELLRLFERHGLHPDERDLERLLRRE